MLRSIKILILGLLLQAGHQASAFSLFGPLAGYQTAALSYNAAPARPTLGGPMNIGEEYRWNVPIITYGYDESFLNYFGTKGVAAIESAVKVFNDLPDADSIVAGTGGDPNLYVNGVPIPPSTTDENVTASNLGLIDLKSFTMSLLMNYLGFSDPERYVWTLHDRNTTQNGTVTNYVVVKRNFDPITFQPSSSVNSAVYTYSIVEFANPQATDAVETMILDPLGTGGFTSVAGFNLASISQLGALQSLFFKGLTRDDIGGLRYVFRRSNVNLETLRAGITDARISSPYSGVGGLTNGAGTNRAVINALRPGIGKVNFKRIDFDSLVGVVGVNPFTNVWTDTYVTNSITKTQQLQAISQFTDFLFVAEDLGTVTPGPGIFFAGSPLVGAPLFSNSRLNGALYPVPLPNADGPGIIGDDLATTPNLFRYTKIGPALINTTAFFFLTEASSFKDFYWGSFDDPNVEPVAYPDGTSIQQLEQLILQR